jgi:agmatine deiminase
MAAVPQALGFRMPAEWEPHEATWLAWPHRRDDWPGKIEAIPWVYCEIVRHLHHAEKVRILVNTSSIARQVLSVLRRAAIDPGQVELYPIGTDRVWVRDYGPGFVVDAAGSVAAIDWHFNAWAKYADWKRDDVVTEQLASRLGFRTWQPEPGRRIVLEGGSIDVNGAGLMLTTEECLLSKEQQRNPDLARDDYERLFAEYLGIRQVLWLGRGIVGDDTHGHVDDLARFVGPHTVVTVVESDVKDENFVPLHENLARLKAMRDVEGRALDVIELPMPAPVMWKGQRLPASYANFYIANGVVLVPTFNDPSDRKALGILADLFPTRTVVGIHAVDLVWGLGTLHCMTQQQPAGPFAPVATN